MRFSLLRLSCVFVLLLLFTLYANADIVNIPDINLRTALEEALGKNPNDPITSEELATLTGDFDASDSNISDLKGLEYCTNLQRLYLNNNQISDISALAGLTNLQMLYLYANQISDISGLAGLTNLEVLYLHSNQISDISVLAELTNLQTLYLGANQISDISALAGLTNLQMLYLYANQISDISALAGLTNLQRLYLAANQISDISVLAELTNLQMLYLNANQVSDISALVGLTNLWSLELHSNQISDISALVGLNNLHGVSLGANQISDISALAGLTNLETLYLSINQVSDISALAGLTNLKDLYLYSNQIRDLRPLVDNPGMGAGDFLNIQSNPLSYYAINISIPILQTRGVDIIFDNRTPGSLLKISGDGQIGAPGSILPDPFVVKVRDQFGVPFEGVPVTFVVTLGGGSLDIESTTTNADGLAWTALTLGPASGTNTVEAIAADISTPVVFDATGLGIPDIDVSPLAYDFGDVELDTFSATIVAISNVGDGDLTVSDIGFQTGSSDFSVTLAPTVPVVVEPGATIDVEITYTPSVLGDSWAVLEIISDDPDESLVEVTLSGAGVEVELPPEEQIAAILDFFDTSVANGTLKGNGPGNSAQGRLYALRNMIEATGDLIAAGFITEARDQLIDAYYRTDGEGPPGSPPDFATGPAAEELAGMIWALIESL